MVCEYLRVVASLYVEYVAGLVDLNLGLPRALLARVLGLEDAGELLERLPSRLDGEEVDEDDLDGDPDAVDNICEFSHTSVNVRAGRVEKTRFLCVYGEGREERGLQSFH